MKYIHFIVNPIAGSGNHNLTSDYFLQYFEKEKYSLVVKHSTYKKHAISLSKESIDEGANIIVACGGDGTINEVASCLVGTSIVLGIIPIGSGNGLASNLSLPKNIEKTIKKIKNEAVKRIDIGRINNKYFFSNMGIGFDAQVVKNYESSKNRKLASYIKASIRSFWEFSFDNDIEIIINDKVILTKPFLIFISNSNELGYNISLTPNALLEDGLLDVLIVSKTNKLKIILFGLLVLFKKQHILKEVKIFQTNRIELNSNNAIQLQIDGELVDIENKFITVSILEKHLSVIV